MKNYAINTVLLPLYFSSVDHCNTNCLDLTHNMFSDIHATHTAQDLTKTSFKTFCRKMIQLTLQEAQGQLM